MPSAIVDRQLDERGVFYHREMAAEVLGDVRTDRAQGVHLGHLAQLHGTHHQQINFLVADDRGACVKSTRITRARTPARGT